MGHVSAILGGLAVLIAPVAVAGAEPETPKTVYERNVGCAGFAAAAVARASAQPPSFEKERSDAATLLAVTRAQATVSGGAIGVPPAEVAGTIERRKVGTLQRIDGAWSAEARTKEEADLGRVVVECALLQAIESKQKK